MIDLIRLFRCLTPWRDNFVYQSSRQVAACLRELGCGAGVPRSGGKQSARGPLGLSLDSPYHSGRWPSRFTRRDHADASADSRRNLDRSLWRW